MTRQTDSSAPPANRVRRRYVLLRFVAAVLFVLSLALSFRGPRPTWADETFTLRIAPVYTRDFRHEIELDVHPPLYFALSSLAAELSPRSPNPNDYPDYSSPPTVRAFSYLIFLALLWMTLRLAGRRVDKPEDMLLPTFLILTSAHLALFGPMMRYYALSALGVMSATLLLLEPVRQPSHFPSRSTVHRAVWYAVAMWVALSSSYITAIVLPAHIIFLLRRPKSEARPFWFALGAVALASLPLLWLLKIQTAFVSHHGSAGLAGVVKGSIARLAFTIYSFLIGEFVRPWDLLLSIPALIAFCFLVFLAWKVRKTALGGLLWLMLAISLPLGAIALALIGVGVEFCPARLFFLAPIFLILLALGPASAGIAPRTAGLGAAAIFVLVVVNLASTFNFHAGNLYIQSTYVIPWKEIGTRIQEISESSNETWVYTDDPTLNYWIEPDYPTKLIPKDIWADEMMLPYREGQGPDTIVLVYSPRAFTDEGIRNTATCALQRSAVLESSIEYLREDETAVRLKSMLLGRPVYEVKKVLAVYHAAG